MIAPTPGRTTPEATATVDAGPSPRTARTKAAATPPPPAPTPDWRSPELRARDLLEKLGRGDHPDAERDPVHALYQVAVDLRCSAEGYRELYLHRVRHTAT